MSRLTPKWFLWFLMLLVIQLPRALASPRDAFGLALLPPANLTGETNSSHWQQSIPTFLRHELMNTRAPRVVPDSSIDFAYRKVGVHVGEMLDEAQARKIGEVVEARRVVWGCYKFDGQKWSLAIRILNTATGKASTTLTAASPDWRDVLRQGANNILRGLGTNPNPQEQKSIESTITNSVQAIDLMSRAYSNLKGGGSIPDAIANLRRALSFDPDFAMALGGLAYFQLLEGRQQEALETARRAVQTHPEYAGAHAALGTVYLFDGLRDLATEEFSEALRLDPNNSQYYQRLGEIYIQQGNWGQARDTLQQAVNSEPFDAVAHAMLGNAFARQGQTGLAVTELSRAEHYDSNSDPGVKQWLARGYELVNDPVRAVENYESFLEASKARGARFPSIGEAETALAALRARLVAHPVPLAPPKDFTSAELEAALKAKLTDAEYNLVIIPFAASPKITEWAQHVTASSQDDLEKAKRLFSAIASEVTTSRDSGGATADAVFNSAINLHTRLACQEYTFLYMAAARQAGLRVWYAVVRKDYLGHAVSHACAALFINGEALLVDPSYGWFGVPHQEFEVLDDVRVVGYYMCQLDDPARVKVGLKLVPDWAEPRFNIAVSFLNTGHLQQARKFFDLGLKLDSTSWRAHYAKSIIEVEDRNWDAAETDLRRCLDLYPDFQGAQYALAGVLLAKGDLPAARDEYRTYLEGETEAESAANARSAIAHINEDLDRRKQVGPSNQ